MFEEKSLFISTHESKCGASGGRNAMLCVIKPIIVRVVSLMT